MWKRFRTDLHIHTCLSPCGDLSMAPGVIVEEALKRGLDAIGICDHNTAENVPAVRKAAEKTRLAVLGGMEVTSQEEVHILALFTPGRDEKLFELQEKVYENLPGLNDEKAFGEQVIVNENNEVTGLNTRLLIGATNLPLDRVVETIRSLSGLAIASHVDRESFGIIGQLGFIPEGLPLDALELSGRIPPDEARAFLPPSRWRAGGFPLVTFSDAHYPEDIGKRSTSFRVAELQVEEIREALLGREGRRVFLEE